MAKRCDVRVGDLLSYNNAVTAQLVLRLEERAVVFLMLDDPSNPTGEGGSVFPIERWFVTSNNYSWLSSLEREGSDG